MMTLWSVLYFFGGLAVAWFLLELPRWAARRRLVKALPPEPEVRAVVQDGYLMLVGTAAAPTDRFVFERALVPVGYEGDVTLKLAQRHEMHPMGPSSLDTMEVRLTKRPLGGYLAETGRFTRRASRAPAKAGLDPFGKSGLYPWLGAEHYVEVHPENTVLLGRLITESEREV